MHDCYFACIFSSRTQGAPGETSQTKVLVRMKNLQNGNEWLWDRAKFMDRRFMMQALYQDYLDDDAKAKKMVGPPTSQVRTYVRGHLCQSDMFRTTHSSIPWRTCSLALPACSCRAWPTDWTLRTATWFGANSALRLPDWWQMITDYKGEEQGTLSVAIVPCNKSGGALGEDFYVEEPSELLAHPYAFKVCAAPCQRHVQPTHTIRWLCAVRRSPSCATPRASSLSTRHSSSPRPRRPPWWRAQAPSSTTRRSSPSTRFDIVIIYYVLMLRIHPMFLIILQVTPELIEWFENGCLNIMVYAAQEDVKADAKIAALSTKELRAFEERSEEGLRKMSFMSKYVTMCLLFSTHARQPPTTLARHQCSEARPCCREDH